MRKAVTSRPAITTVRQDGVAAGRALGTAIVEMVEGKTSDAARAWVQRVIAREREAVADKRAAGKAREAVVVDATITDARVGRVGRVIARAVQRAGEDGLTRNQVREKVASRDRDDFEAGLQFALAASWVAEVERPQARSDDPVRVFIPGREAV